MSGDASDHVGRYIGQTFGLDAMGLQRVGLFLLAHVLIDTRLIARAMFKRSATEALESDCLSP